MVLYEGLVRANSILKSIVQLEKQNNERLKAAKLRGAELGPFIGLIGLNRFIYSNCPCTCKFQYMLTQKLVVWFTNSLCETALHHVQCTHISGHQRTWCHWLYRSQALSDLLVTPLTCLYPASLLALSRRSVADLGIYPITYVSVVFYSWPGSPCPLMFTHITNHCSSGNFIYSTWTFKPIFQAFACTTCPIIRRIRAKQIWCLFHQRPARDMRSLMAVLQTYHFKGFLVPIGVDRWQ